MNQGDLGLSGGEGTENFEKIVVFRKNWQFFVALGEIQLSFDRYSDFGLIWVKKSYFSMFEKVGRFHKFSWKFFETNCQYQKYKFRKPFSISKLQALYPILYMRSKQLDGSYTRKDLATDLEYNILTTFLQFSSQHIQLSAM